MSDFDREREMFDKELAMNSAGRFGNNNYQSPMDNNGGNIIILTNPESELRSLELSLRNLEETETGELISKGEPLLNNDGINSVISQIKSVVNRISVVSNFEDKHIMGLMEYFADTLARDLMMNRRAYKIKNGYDRDKIYFSCLSTAFVTLRRAANEGERRFWRGSQQEITTRIEGANRANKGFFQKMISGSFK